MTVNYASKDFMLHYGQDEFPEYNYFESLPKFREETSSVAENDLESQVGQLNSDNYNKDPAYSGGKSGGVWRVMALNAEMVIGASYDHYSRAYVMGNNALGEMTLTANYVLRHKSEVFSLEKIANQVITGTSGGVMSFWNSQTGQHEGFMSEPKGHRYGFYSLCVLDNSTIVSGSCHVRSGNHAGSSTQQPWRHLVKVWSLAQKRFLFEMEGHEGGISAIKKLDDTHLVSSSADKTLRIWDIRNRTSGAVILAHKDYVYSLAVSENRDYAFSGSRDKTVKMWDLTTQTQVRSFDGPTLDSAHSSTVYDVACHGNTLIASASRDGYIKLWDTRSDGVVSILDPEDGFVYAVNFTDDGKIVAGTSGKAKKSNRANIVVYDNNQKV